MMTLVGLAKFDENITEICFLSNVPEGSTRMETSETAPNKVIQQGAFDRELLQHVDCC